MADCPYAECSKQPKPPKYLKLKSSVSVVKQKATLVQQLVKIQFTIVIFSHDQLEHIVDRVVAEADVNEVFKFLFQTTFMVL